MKPPQERKTPYDFDTDRQIARVSATDTLVRIQTRTHGEGSYSTRFEAGLDDAKRLRDILDAWIENHDEEVDDE